MKPTLAPLKDQRRHRFGVVPPDFAGDAAEEVGLELTEDDVKSYLGLIKPNIDAYNMVDAMPDLRR